jgi:hypothetical protein
MGVGDRKLKPDAYKGNHGSLTSADAVVPIAFGYPGWTGASGTSGTTFSQLKSYLTTAGAGATEAEAMRVVLFRPRP